MPKYGLLSPLSAQCGQRLFINVQGDAVPSYPQATKRQCGDTRELSHRQRRAAIFDLANDHRRNRLL